MRRWVDDTVGLQERPDYLFRRPDGRRLTRPGLSFDLRGHHLPQWSVLAFPGEEPPQIECNEDAAGEHTDE